MSESTGAAPGAKVDAALVREMLGVGTPAEAAGPRTLDHQVADYERQLIVAEMERKGGVIAEAARALGVDRTTLSKKCKRLGIRGTG